MYLALIIIKKWLLKKGLIMCVWFPFKYSRIKNYKKKNFAEFYSLLYPIIFLNFIFSYTNFNIFKLLMKVLKKLGKK